LVKELIDSFLLLSSGNWRGKSNFSCEHEGLKNCQRGEELVILHHIRWDHLHVACTYLHSHTLLYKHNIKLYQVLKIEQEKITPTGFPSIRTDPSRLPFAIRPAMASRNVDFPAPLGPMIAMISPLIACPEISFRRYASLVIHTPSFFCFFMTLYDRFLNSRPFPGIIFRGSGATPFLLANLSKSKRVSRLLFVSDLPRLAIFEWVSTFWLSQIWVTRFF